MGQPKKELKEHIVTLYHNGHKVNEIAKGFNVPKSTIYNWIRASDLITDKATNDKVSYKEYIRLQKELTKAKLLLEIYENLHCFKDATILEKEVAISRFVGVYPIKTMCKLLGLPHGTFYNYYLRRRSVTQYQLRDEELKVEILKVFNESGERFGAKKILLKLQDEGIKTSLRKVQSMMQKLNIRSSQKLKKKEEPNPNSQYYVNKLKRSFVQDTPNKCWVGDITEVRVGTNKFYLCAILDLFSRKVIAYRISSQNNTRLTINTFKDAFESRGRPTGVCFHRDQGSNYTAFQYKDLLRALRVDQSFSRAGNPYDNACMESFFSNFKREEYNTKQYEYFEDLENSVSAYMHYYNEYRPHQSLSNKTPEKFEKDYYQGLTSKKGTE